MLSPQFITGLTEGEGTFTFSRNVKQGAINLYYAIKLSSKDFDLLKQVQEFFGFGKIYFTQSRRGVFGNLNYVSRPGVYYRVTRLQDLLKVVQHFETYPLHGNKAKVFQLWKQMVFLKKRMFSQEMPKMLSLAVILAEMNGPGKKMVTKVKKSQN